MIMKERRKGWKRQGKEDGLQQKESKKKRKIRKGRNKANGNKKKRSGRYCIYIS